jgi:acetylornithine deacetylase/succinyl-diaminopimelate desuccinylase-like protein
MRRRRSAASAKRENSTERDHGSRASRIPVSRRNTSRKSCADPQPFRRRAGQVNAYEGAWGVLDANGKRVMMAVQAGEKTYQDFQLEVQNPGGHSSRPVKSNAIYQLAGALTRIEHYDFPIQLNETTRAYFSRMAGIVGGETGAAMTRLVADPTDAAAGAKVAEDPGSNGMLRTTCVATMLEGGHAPNALPQRARANVNCRVYPGESMESVRQTLERVVADAEVEVTTKEISGPLPVVPPLTRDIMAPIEKVSAQLYPGVPVIPILQPGGPTDGSSVPRAFRRMESTGCSWIQTWAAFTDSMSGCACSLCTTAATSFTNS